ncbi:MAG TPA: hypothetical protein VFY83_03185 [Anaerolineales bacterium]|jgi:hypothetical protein|nr:hypothetical protein [Anaerolineales bacterium]
MSSDGLLEPKNNPRVVVLAYSLWLVSAALGVLTFLAGREMIIRTYVRFFPWEVSQFQLGLGTLSLVNIIISMTMAMLVIVIIIGGFEYQHRNMGQPQGWVMLERTLAVEIGILLLALYI